MVVEMEMSHHPPTMPKCPHEANVFLGLNDKGELFSSAEGHHVSAHLGAGCNSQATWVRWDPPSPPTTCFIFCFVVKDLKPQHTFMGDTYSLVAPGHVC